MGADFRSVQTRMWREDEWFQSLDTEARLLFIYLFTNPSASISGIYRLPIRTMAFESGLPVERVQKLLAQFSKANKAHYADGVVWVVRMRENQLPGVISPKIQVRLDKDIVSIPDCELKNRYLIAYGYPINTVSIPIHTDTDTDTVTDTFSFASQTEAQATPVAAKPTRASKSKNPYIDHPAVIAYRDFHGRWPQTAQMKLIAERNPPIANWVRALAAWAGEGYSAVKIAGMLDWAENPAKIDAAQWRNRQPATNGNGTYTNGNGNGKAPGEYPHANGTLVVEANGNQYVRVNYGDEPNDVL